MTRSKWKLILGLLMVSSPFWACWGVVLLIAPTKTLIFTGATLAFFAIVLLWTWIIHKGTKLIEDNG